MPNSESPPSMDQPPTLAYAMDSRPASIAGLTTYLMNAASTTPRPPETVAPAPRPPDHNLINLDFHRPWARPPIRGSVIDAHCHILAARHANIWFEAADHYGIDTFFSMGPLEEAIGLQRRWGRRVHFIAVPDWMNPNADLHDWRRRIDAFYNLGSRVVKFHMAPQTMHTRRRSLDTPEIRDMLRDAANRGMIVMTHVGDPDTWYCGRYTDCKTFGTREAHYDMWERALADHAGHPWIGAHLGGNPENLPRLQRLLDIYPHLWLDCSATRWMVREVSARRDEAREFFIHNQDRILFGSDQVSGDSRDFDFYASRFWCHRKLWETAYTGPSPIFDPDLPPDAQPELRGLALPAEVLQKLYRDNAAGLFAQVGVSL